MTTRPGTEEEGKCFVRDKCAARGKRLGIQLGTPGRRSGVVVIKGDPGKELQLVSQLMSMIKLTVSDELFFESDFVFDFSDRWIIWISSTPTCWMVSFRSKNSPPVFQSVLGIPKVCIIHNS